MSLKREILWGFPGRLRWVVLAVGSLKKLLEEVWWSTSEVWQKIRILARTATTRAAEVKVKVKQYVVSE